ASTDATVGNSDDVVVGRFTHSGALDVGQGYSQSQSVLLPPAFTGRYHLFVQADAGNQVFENGNKADNVAEAPGLLNAMPIPYADLTVTSLDVAPSGLSGQPLHVAWQVTNQGIGPTNKGTWNDLVTLTSDPAGQHVVATLGIYSHVGLLNVRDSYQASLDAPLPNGISGTFYVAVQTNVASPAAFEYLFTDNDTRVSDPVAVTLAPAPELVVSSVTIPTLPVLSGSRVDISWAV